MTSAVKHVTVDRKELHYESSKTNTGSNKSTARQNILTSPTALKKQVEAGAIRTHQTFDKTCFTKEEQTHKVGQNTSIIQRRINHQFR